MNCLTDLKNKFIKWLDEAKEPGKEGTNKHCGDKIPNKEHNNTMLGRRALFPSDTRM